MSLVPDKLYAKCRCSRSRMATGARDCEVARRERRGRGQFEVPHITPAVWSAACACQATRSLPIVSQNVAAATCFCRKTCEPAARRYSAEMGWMRAAQSTATDLARRVAPAPKQSPFIAHTIDVLGPVDLAQCRTLREMEGNA